MKIDEPIPGTDQRVLRFTGEGQKVNSAVALTLQVLEMGAEFAFSKFQTPSFSSSAPLSSPMRRDLRDPPGAQYPYPSRGNNSGMGSYGGNHLQHQEQQQQFFPAPQRMYRQETPVLEQPPKDSLALGADGSAGLLYPSELLSDGIYSQEAVLRSGVAGRVVGKSGSILELVRLKSGASIVIDKAETPAADSHCKVHMMGDLASIELAAKMIQEVHTLTVHIYDRFVFNADEYIYSS